MNVTSLTILTILFNIIIIGCTPVNVTLNSEFGLSVNKSPGEEQGSSQLLSITSQPPYINKNNAGGISFSGTCENISSILVKVNESKSNLSVLCNAGVWNTTIDTSTAPDGPVSFEFLNASNSKSLKKFSLAKDTVPPSAQLAMVIPAISNETMLSVSVDPTLGVSNFSYKYGLAATTDCTVAAGYSTYLESGTSGISTISTGDENYKLCLIGKDAFENEQPYTSATVVTWSLDTTLPSLSLLSATSTQYINSLNKGSFLVTVMCSEIGRNVRFTATDKNALVATRNEMCPAGGSVSTSFDLSTLSEGNVDFQVYQTDLAGNTKLQNILFPLKDVTPPVFASSVVSDGNYYNSTTQGPLVSWSAATDTGGSGFSEFKIGYGNSTASPNVVSYMPMGTNTSNMHGFGSTPLTQNATYYAFVKAIDLAGNSAVIISDGWIVDTTAPTVGSVNDGINSTPGTTPAVSWGAGTDGSGSGIDHYDMAIGTTSGGTQILNWFNVGSVTSITHPHSGLDYGGGPYYVSIRAVDGAGNVGTPSYGNGFTIKPTIFSLTSNNCAHAAIMTTGKVISWGDVSCGGSYTAVPISLKSGPLTTTALSTTSGAFAAITNDGAVHTWGDNTKGGDSTSVSSSLNGSIDVVEIKSNLSAFAARRANGSVVAWGNVSYGGSIPIDAALALDGTIPAIEIKSTSSAFAAIRADGSVVAWGDKGGDLSSVSSLLDGTIDVVALYSTSSAFIARRTDGSLVTWGYHPSGVGFTSIAGDVNGSVPVTNVYTNATAVAALRNDGSVITWGKSDHGGDSSSVSSHINGTIDLTSLYSNPTSFAAIRADGSVITWGESGDGGGSSSVAAQLTGSPYKTTHIGHTNYAFAALRNDGSVIIWGQNSSGGGLGSLPSSAINGSVSKVVDVVGSWAAFAALREDGSVVTWGDSDYGGNSSSVASKINGTKDIVAVYSNQWSFVAVYADGQFVTWGDETFGGDSSAVNPN